MGQRSGPWRVWAVGLVSWYFAGAAAFDYGCGFSLLDVGLPVLGRSVLRVGLLAPRMVRRRKHDDLLFRGMTF